MTGSLFAQKPPARRKRLVLHCDGGSRGNPGPAGCGAVVTDEAGCVLAERGKFLGQATNNVAEYSGLIDGLNLCLELGGTDLLIQADSELLVRQLNGEYKVKNAGLKPLFSKAQQLLGRFAAWKAEHVRREFNCRADELANEAMDRGK